MNIKRLKYFVTVCILSVFLVPTAVSAEITRDTAFYLNFSGTSSSTGMISLSEVNALLVCFLRNESGPNDFVSASLNGVPLINKNISTTLNNLSKTSNLWVLPHPTSGIFTVRRLTSGDTWVECENLNGASQALDDIISTTAHFKPGEGVMTTGISTIAGNSWTILNANGERAQNAGVGSTYVLNNNSGAFTIFDSNGVVPSKGTTSMSISQESDTYAVTTILVAIAPHFSGLSIGLFRITYKTLSLLVIAIFIALIVVIFLVKLIKLGKQNKLAEKQERAQELSLLKEIRDLVKK